MTRRISNLYPYDVNLSNRGRGGGGIEQVLTRNLLRSTFPAVTGDGHRIPMCPIRRIASDILQLLVHVQKSQ